MSDYALTDGKGTKVTESSGLQKGYVDIDVNALSVVAEVLETDSVLVQRGASDPLQATKAQLTAVTGQSLTELYIY